MLHLLNRRIAQVHSGEHGKFFHTFTRMKIRLLLYPLFFLCFSQTLNGQNRYLHDRLGNLNSITSDAVFFLEYKMEPTPDGGFVIANKEWNSPHVFVLKYDSCGYLSWSKRLEKMFNYGATCSRSTYCRTFHQGDYTELRD